MMMSRMDKSREKEDIKQKEWVFFLKRARDFQEKRLQLIQKGGVWNGRSPGPYCILHWMPMSPKEKYALDIESIIKHMHEDFIVFKDNRHIKPTREQNGLLIETNCKDRGEWSKCSDGWCRYYRGFQYTQIFHSGALEAVYAPTIERRKGMRTNYLSLYAFEFFRLQIKNCIEKASALGFLGAGVMGVTIIDVKGYTIYTPVRTPGHLVHLRHKISADGDEVINSAESDIGLEWKVSSIAEIKNIDGEILALIFNKIWQHFGLPECDRNFWNGLWNL